MDTRLAGQFTDSLISIADFRAYHDSRANSSITIATTDADIEKYIITTTNLLNSFNWVGYLPKRTILYRGQININYNTLYLPDVTDIDTYINAVGTRFLLRKEKDTLVPTHDQEVTGVILGIDTTTNTIGVEFDEEQVATVGTGTEELVLGCLVQYSTSYIGLFRYNQHCCFPRYLNFSLFQDFMIPSVIKTAICELGMLISTTDLWQSNSSSSQSIKYGKLDVLEVEFFENVKKELALENIPSFIYDMLAPFLLNSKSCAIPVVKRYN
jgi:hypothetical protein